MGLKEVVLFPDDAGKGNASSYDLVFTDKADDGDLDAGVSVFVGVVPPDLGPMLSVKTGLAEVVDWDRSEPLLQHVQMLDVQIADQPTAKAGVAEQDYEELGYSILAYGRTGPLILKKRAGERQAYYVLFHTDRSTFPYRVGFPIMVTNAVDIAMHLSELAEVRSPPTGVLPPRTLSPERAYEVTSPDGKTQEVASDKTGVVSGISAPRVGRYVLKEGRRPVAAVGVSLLAAGETSLASVDELQFRELSVAAAQATVKSDHPLWRLLAGLAFCVLLVEWWYFQKRPGGMAT